jgi:hypothetical protein
VLPTLRQRSDQHLAITNEAADMFCHVSGLFSIPLLTDERPPLGQPQTKYPNNQA